MKSFLNDDFFGRLETLALNLNPSLSGFFGGVHRTNTYGQTVEFADYREYQLGDDIRRIDWNLYSRFEKYFIKLFTDERQMHTQVFIDCSASMQKTDPKKPIFAISAAAALGFLSVHNMDKASFKLIKGDRAEDVAGTIVGKTAFFNAINLLVNTDYGGQCNISEAVINCPNTGSNDGLTVIISDFMDDHWKKAVDFLCFKKRQVLLLQILSPEEIDPTYDGRMDLIDAEAEGTDDPKNLRIKISKSEQRNYDRALREIRAEIQHYCRSRGADFVSVSTAQPVEKVLFNELLKLDLMV
ncbi:MAG: DUF58 domain-containing protein [Firmicutes bacterium]|nr:DUF58 domain-containing protein [Bacillota bacterium]